jgi:feruloyl esterase
MRAAAVLAVVAGLALPGVAAAGKPKPVEPKGSTAACAQLTGLKVKASKIRLPTRGAVVESATLTAADAALGRPEFCLVRGHVNSHDPAAPPINFEVNLPTVWNQKTIQFGGGGFNGNLVTGLERVPGSAPATNNAAPPINRGYVTFGSDGGTSVGSGAPGSFGLNAEALANFSGQSVKRTRDTAMAIVKAYYRKKPAYDYHAGGSKGGHEGLVAVQRYAKDYDGVIAYYPAAENAGLVLPWHNMTEAAYNRPGGYLNPTEQLLLVNAVYAACDGLDGVVDGVVSHVQSCDQTFDVTTLRCAGGGDTGDTCLSQTQIETVQAGASEYTWAFPVARGNTSTGPFPVLHGAYLSDLAAWLDSTGTGAFTGMNIFRTGVIRYFWAHDATVPIAGFDYRPYRDAITDVSWQYDANDPDIDAFARRGGKLLMVQGTTDMLVPQDMTNDYYESLVARYGRKVANFVRYYVVPGYGHGSGRFNASYDSLTALENWVEHGTAPTNQVVYDGSAATRDRSRPLCEYPTWPRYVSGDVNQASSYRCVSG